MASGSSRSFSTRNGFTLIELIVVLSIVGVLLTLALPRYFQSLDRTRDVVLEENLHTLRRTIDKFYSDTGRYPDSLEELVERKYFRVVPLDPVTERRDSWILIAPDGDTQGRVYDVKSSAEGNTTDGRSYHQL